MPFIIKTICSIKGCGCDGVLKLGKGKLGFMTRVEAEFFIYKNLPDETETCDVWVWVEYEHDPVSNN